MAQSATAPDGITVVELVARGRFPHQRPLRQWSRADEGAAAQALSATVTADLSTAWSTNLRPYLDIAHRIQVLNLLHELHQQARAVVAVLHDLNRAAR
ncbi:hypothetical protein [Nocardia sp. NPDC060259]|uniref:hypothetical protein n=1 Tax=Nocardia sp. NPDC060259 TaxID=3347088 RepID=UPI00364DB505